MPFDFGGAGKGAISGAAAGSTFGPWGTAIGGAIGGIAGGISGRKKQTKTQKSQQKLIDQLIASLNGNGPYSDLFSANEADFEKSFAEPARQRFKNQTTPQIQQGYIMSGQQRGTGLEDKLARAGVDMDSLINQHYLNFQNAAKDRQANAMGQILGYKGTGDSQSILSGALEGLGNYAGSEAFGKDLEDILDLYKDENQQSESIQDTFMPQREGFENEPQYYDWKTGVMG